MGYVDRAKSMYARGDSVRTAMILAQGLKRDPTDVEAVEWLLHLYVEDVPHPGMESAVLHVLARQENGSELLEIVEAELAEIGAHDKLRAIDKVLDLESIHFHEPAPPEPAEPAPPATLPEDDSASSEFRAAAAWASSAENWDAFDDPFGGDPDGGPSPAGPPGRRPAEAAEVDTSMSQPLGTIDTLPDDLKAEYGTEAPLPSEAAIGSSRGALAALAAVVIVVIAAIAVYALRSGDPEEAVPTWAEEEGSG